MIDLTNWKSMAEIDIVYARNNKVTFNNQSYPMAYIVEHGKPLDAAITWARWYNDKPQITTTENEGFTMQIVEAPGNSSQSGKLSFWTCVFKKDDVPAFAAGINSELLDLILLQSEFKNGALQNETIFFAKCSQQLGAVHKNMAECKTIADKEALRATMGHKTSKWKTGYEYKTLTCSETMLGWFKSILSTKIDYVWTKPNRVYKTRIKIDFNAPEKAYYWKTEEPNFCNGAVSDFEARYINALIESRAYDKCPARMEGNQIFDASDLKVLHTDIINTIDKIVSTEMYLPSDEKYRYTSPGTYNFGEMINAIGVIYDIDKNEAIRLLNNIATKDKSTIHIPYNEFIVEHDGQKWDFNCISDCINKIIEIIS